jgi:hypothetical protein
VLHVTRVAPVSHSIPCVLSYLSISLTELDEITCNKCNSNMWLIFREDEPPLTGRRRDSSFCGARKALHPFQRNWGGRGCSPIRSFCVSLKGMLIMSVELLDDSWCKSDPATWTREDEGDVYASFERVQLFGLTETDERFFGKETTFKATGWLAVVEYELEPGKLTMQAAPLDERHLIRVTCSDEGGWSVDLGTILDPDVGTLGQHPVDLIEIPGGVVKSYRGVAHNCLDWVRIAAVIRSGDDFGSPQQRLRSWAYASSAPVGEGRRRIDEGLRI